MMSPENPYGLRPDELASAIINGNLGSAKIPTVAEMGTAIKQYNSSSSVKYTADEEGLFRRMAEAINKTVVQPVTETVQRNTQVQQVQPVFTNPFENIALPMTQQQVQQGNGSGLLAGIEGSKVEQYIIIAFLFMIISSILGLFRR